MEVPRLLPHRFPGREENWSEYICCDSCLCLPSSWLIKRQLISSLPFDKGVNLCEDILWLLRARASDLIIPGWHDDALVVFHNDHTEMKRLSKSPDWEVVYRWAVTNQKALFTRRAFAYCLIRFCFPRAKQSRTPLRDCLQVLSTAVSTGRVDLRFFALVLAHTCLTAGARSRLRDRYETLTRRLVKGAYTVPSFPLGS